MSPQYSRGHAGNKIAQKIKKNMWKKFLKKVRQSLVT